MIISQDKPEDLHSLPQLMKYMLEHNTSHNVVANSSCQNNDTIISELAFNLFSRTFYGKDNIKFTLCYNENDEVPIDFSCTSDSDMICKM